MEKLTVELSLLEVGFILESAKAYTFVAVKKYLKEAAETKDSHVYESASSAADYLLETCESIVDRFNALPGVLESSAALRKMKDYEKSFQSLPDGSYTKQILLDEIVKFIEEIENKAAVTPNVIKSSKEQLAAYRSEFPFKEKSEVEK